MAHICVITSTLASSGLQCLPSHVVFHSYLETVATKDTRCSSFKVVKHILARSYDFEYAARWKVKCVGIFLRHAWRLSSVYIQMSGWFLHNVKQKK